MDQHQIMRAIARIMSGSVRLPLKDSFGRPLIVVLNKPTAEQAYLAEEVYFEVKEDALRGGAMSEEELLHYLFDKGLWTQEQEDQMEGIPKDIEKLKVGLYEAVYRSEEREVLRKMLARAKEVLQDLNRIRHRHDELSAEGIALSARFRFLIGVGLYFPNGNPVFTADDFWNRNDPVLEDAMRTYADVRFDDTEIREIARSNHWRSYWSCKEACQSVFGHPVPDLTEEQRHLINWSQTYDNVYSHPDCPGEQVIKDDDMLDGWMIIQRRKREQHQKHGEIDGVLGKNEKVRNSQEVFVVAQSAEDVERVQNLNDPFTKARLKSRFNKMRKEGSVNEVHMPDTKREIQQRMNQLFFDKAKK